MTGMNRALGAGSKVKVLLKGQGGEMMLIKNTPRSLGSSGYSFPDSLGKQLLNNLFGG